MARTGAVFTRAMKLVEAGFDINRCEFGFAR